MTIQSNSVLHNMSSASASQFCDSIVNADGAASVAIDNSTLSGGGSGIYGQFNGATNTTITLSGGTTFGAFLLYGINANVGGVLTLNVTDATITTGVKGINLTGKSVVRMRDSHVTGNTVGLETRG